MSVGVSGCQWVSVGVSGSQWVSVGVRVCVSVCVFVRVCQCVSVNAHLCQRVSVCVNGCQLESEDECTYKSANLSVVVIGKTMTILRAINAVGVDVRGKVMFKVISVSISTSI